MLVAEQPDIGNLIRDFRKEIKLTQEKFAQQLGVSFSTLNRWKKGRATRSPLVLKIIVQKLEEISTHGRDLLERHFVQ